MTKRSFVGPKTERGEWDDGQSELVKQQAKPK